MEKLFMLDIETTGTNVWGLPKSEENQSVCDLLQLVILALQKDEKGFWRAGRWYEWLKYHPVPENPDPFQRKHQMDLYERCMELGGKENPSQIRQQILNFLESESGTKNLSQNVIFTGWNVTTLDLPVLHRDGYLHPPYTNNETEKLHGDHHYRTYEMGGSVFLMVDTFKEDRNSLLKKAKSLGRLHTNIPHWVERRGSHDALFDCFEQTAILNGLIDICQTGKEIQR